MGVPGRRTRKALGSPHCDCGPGLLIRPAVRDELLAAVDVVGGDGEGCVGHDVQCQGGDIRRADHPADRQRLPQLFPACFELVSDEEADSGVSTKPATMRLTRAGAGSSARLAVSAGSAAVSAPRPSGRRTVGRRFHR